MASFKKELGGDESESTKREIFDLISVYDNGISEEELSKTMSSTPVQTRMDAINALTNEGKIQLCKRGSDLVYRAIDSRTSANHSAALSANISVEERAVYQVIESAGSKGIWNRDIRYRVIISVSQMSKVLKNLETKKLIKAVKSVNASKKKLYMLYQLEPDKSVTGGAWYSETEFESEYVQILHEQCYNFIKSRSVSAEGVDFADSRHASLVSSAEVKDYINNSKISTVVLTLQDIEMLLETIVFDGLVEKITIATNLDDSVPVKSEKALTSDEEESEAPSHTTHYYRATPKLVESSGVMRVPCGQCPHIHECRPGAVISPENCLYFERWFSE